MPGEYFLAKLFFWVISVRTEASAEASTVTWKKNVKKTQPLVQSILNNLIIAQKWITWHRARDLKACTSEHDYKQSSEVIPMHFSG